MHILLVDDHALNEFIMTHLLQMALPIQIKIKAVTNSKDALDNIASCHFDLVILDGDLGVCTGSNMNGPALAAAIWQKKENIPIIAWSDSVTMRAQFDEVFASYGKNLSFYNCWPKKVSVDFIEESMEHLKIEEDKRSNSCTQIREPQCQRQEIYAC